MGAGQAAVRARLRDQAKNAKTFKSSANVEAYGVYEFEIESVNVNEGKDKKGNYALWFAAEFKTITSRQTNAKKMNGQDAVPNAAGSTCALKINCAQEWARSAMNTFLEAVMDTPINEILAVQDDLIDPATKEKIALFDLVTGDQNILKGARIMCETFEKPLRDDPTQFRTRMIWSHTPETRAATQKVLDG